MSDDQKYEVVASVKISDLIHRQKTKASLLDGAAFVLLWGLYYWYFVYGGVENSQHSLIDTAKYPDLAQQENALKNIYFYAACILGIAPILGFLACRDRCASVQKESFWLVVLRLNFPVLMRTLLYLVIIVPILIALTCGGGFLLITNMPDAIRSVPWIGGIVVTGGIIIFVAMAIFASLLCALFVYFFNLYKNISMASSTAEGQ